MFHGGHPVFRGGARFHDGHFHRGNTVFFGSPFYSYGYGYAPYYGAYPGYIWVPGYWYWDGTQWVWQPGYYAPSDYNY